MYCADFLFPIIYHLILPLAIKSANVNKTQKAYEKNQIQENGYQKPALPGGSQNIVKFPDFSCLTSRLWKIGIASAVARTATFRTVSNQGSSAAGKTAPQQPVRSKLPPWASLLGHGGSNRRCDAARHGKARRTSEHLRIGRSGALRHAELDPRMLP